MFILGVQYDRTFSEKYARVQAKCDRMQAACSLHTIVFRGATPSIKPYNPMERGTLEGNAAFMQVAYRNAGCMQPALPLSVPPA